MVFIRPMPMIGPGMAQAKAKRMSELTLNQVDSCDSQQMTSPEAAAMIPLPRDSATLVSTMAPRVRTARLT